MEAAGDSKGGGYVPITTGNETMGGLGINPAGFGGPVPHGIASQPGMDRMPRVGFLCSGF
jgi:hypothetical protein